MPFSKCSTVPYGRLHFCKYKNFSGKLNQQVRFFALRDYWYFSQNYDLPQGTESNSRKGTNNLIQEY